jgi:hypothetical protein
MRHLALGLCMLVACGGDGPLDPDAGGDPRRLSATLTVGAEGLSEPMSFTLPAGTRSITVVVEGDPAALYALGAFGTADGVERVGLAPGDDPGAIMQTSYFEDQIGQLPRATEDALFQSIRLGTFTQVYPARPEESLTPGVTTLRVASDRPGLVQVTVLMPADDGASVLHLNVIAVSSDFTFTLPPSFTDEVQAIFAPAGIEVVIDEVLALPDSGLSTITDFSEPQESPTSMSAMLPGLVPDGTSPRALDVFVVDALPPGVGGLSLGTPGPPLRGSFYYGVVLRRTTDDARQAVVLAHEVAHFLALQHVVNVGLSGELYPDPLADTEPGQDNLMEDGTLLTEDQAFALRRSALLRME